MKKGQLQRGMTSERLLTSPALSSRVQRGVSDDPRCDHSPWRLVPFRGTRFERRTSGECITARMYLGRSQRVCNEASIIAWWWIIACVEEGCRLAGLDARYGPHCRMG
ncbi:hypothetical protein BV22DRAFT_602154 [Leucogyrophana mollusca]|uniref:Uncharacterized protein n=1 Tax=Leucogyrophana mollusca TaxID=85980 RepID=A0ACB8BC21_9AGAM|nr:hypothetical protein BV22DRAFT_602154 [Leucogyrophana mollusca]